MIDLSYAYANSRVKGMKSNLLGEDELRGLFSAKTQDSFIALLEDTQYKESVVAESVNHKGIDLVLAALRREFDRTVNELYRVVPEPSKKKMQALIARWQLKYIQVLLASKAAGIPMQDDYIDFLPQKTRDKLRGSIEAQTFDEALARLPSTEFGGVSKKIAEEYRRTHDMRAALRTIDQSYMESLVEYIRVETDREARAILKAELDQYNLTTALRLKKAGLPASAILPSIYRSSSPGTEVRVANAANLEEAVRIIERDMGLRGLLEGSKETESTAYAELELEKKMFSKILSATRVSVLSFGAVLGVLYLKRREIENLRMIAISLQFPGREEFRKNVYSLKGAVVQ